MTDLNPEPLAGPLDQVPFPRMTVIVETEYGKTTLTATLTRMPTVDLVPDTDPPIDWPFGTSPWPGKQPSYQIVFHPQRDDDGHDYTIRVENKNPEEKP